MDAVEDERHVRPHCDHWLLFVLLTCLFGLPQRSIVATTVSAVLATLFT